MQYLLDKPLYGESLTFEEALYLYKEAPFQSLAASAHALRIKKKGASVVTWQIDRNVNITNVCISGCLFCNFHCKPHEHEKAYVTTIEEYSQKIEETLALGGDQLLMQGGMHPELGIAFYENLFRELKRLYPQIRIHALGPPEVAHISRISRIPSRTVLERLISAGLDSFPGGGAEILDSGLRKRLSPGKCSAEEWLRIMGEAHSLHLATSATMMYGHIESEEQRIRHLIDIRELQSRKPKGAPGFLAFIPWVFWASGTKLERQGIKADNSELGYLRLIAISRLVLDNIDNIQASWLTMGRDVGELALHCGANDLGSVMIEENVVSSAGASFTMTPEEMRQTISRAGFIPVLRDQLYNSREI